MSPRGQIALVLHAHLPFVRHPEHTRHLEEHWLFDAITDCYLPLIRLLREAEDRGSCFRLTVSLSPTLLSMLADPLLQGRYLDHISRLARLCETETGARGSDPARRPLARYYLQRFRRARAFYRDELRGDLIGAWSRLSAAGMVELMTTAATHGYLPLLRGVPSAVRAQLSVARDHFRRVFGQAPQGLWLPECGYYPGLEREVAAAGFRYFVLDAHGLQQAIPAPRQSVYAPVSADGGVAVFGRDPDSARDVWSRDAGFPGNPAYREYHRDLGFESGGDSLAEFLPPGVTAAPTGLKYYRVTGGRGPKSLYDPLVALEQAKRDAALFVDRRRRLFAGLAFGPRPPIVVAPFDAELFGHWWFEGPAFLRGVIRELDDAPEIRAVTLGEHLRHHGTSGDVSPAASSWGEQGYNGTWLRPETGWVHLRLHQAATEFSALVRRRELSRERNRRSRLLCQAARSLLLAQSSDWTFLMGRGAGSDYAESRVRDQLARYRFLTRALRSGAVSERQVAALERMDNLFPHLDLRHFA